MSETMTRRKNDNVEKAKLVVEVVEIIGNEGWHNDVVNTCETLYEEQSERRGRCSPYESEPRDFLVWLDLECFCQR